MDFAICPGCKVSMTLPEGYVSYGPWLAAHQKTCPGEQKPVRVASVRKKKRAKKSELPFEVQVDQEVVDRVAGAFLRAVLKRIR